MLTTLLLKLLVFPLGSFFFFYCLFALRAPLLTFAFGTNEALWASIVAGSFTWLALNKWNSIRRIRSELAIVDKLELADGERAVVSGRVMAKGTPLESPCSGTQCVAFRYKVIHKGTGGSFDDRRIQLITDYEGHAMTPSVVKGAMKSVSILAEPDNIEFMILEPGPKGFNGVIIEGNAAKDRVRQYLENIDFGDDFNDRLNAGMEAKKKETYIGPGNFSINICLKEADPISDNSRLSETVIAEGETLLVSGIYYADKNGIGPGSNSTLEPLRLIKDGVAALNTDIAGKKKTIKISFGLAALISIIYFFTFVLLQG